MTLEDATGSPPKSEPAKSLSQTKELAQLFRVFHTAADKQKKDIMCYRKIPSDINA